MAEYIKREELKEMLRREWAKYVPMELDPSLAFVLAKIDELSSIDIVICKDCEYSIEVKESDSIICKHPSQHATYERTSDDYCSYGKRENNEEL